MCKDIKEIIKSMSLDEKVAQLCGIQITQLIEGEKLSISKC